MVALKTSRLLIRSVEERDWRAIREIRIRFAESPYARYDRPFDTGEEAVRQRVARWASLSACDTQDHLFFSVCLKDTVIGYLALNRRADSHEIGYCFHTDYHGHGYAGESIGALLAYAKENGIRRITAGTALNNLPSVRLLRALGFRQTGTETVSFEPIRSERIPTERVPTEKVPTEQVPTEKIPTEKISAGIIPTETIRFEGGLFEIVL